MQKLKKVKAFQEVVDDIICDCCGKSCFDRRKLNYEFARFQATWGYYSNKDGTTWTCDLCEECADKVKEFIESLGGTVRISSYI